MDAATLTYDTLRFGEFEEFPETPEPVWILGKQFSALTEKDELLSDIASRLWLTYRKNFPPIGGTGPTSDTGWGCMLRCGQMILGEALVRRHLGRDWRWVRGQRQREEYSSILNAFIDKKDSYYSIHQIAQMGVGEGKSIGQWYGPNTVAQVLKKLAVFDSWSRMAVHVAMDNTVVIEEIKKLCMPWLDFDGAGCSEGATAGAGARQLNGCLGGACALAEEETALWRPLVLLIPLRLGLTDINEAYIETLKQCFMSPQSLGVIGGKPNSAHYFIGFVGEELIYLDPHTTQPAVEPSEDSQVPDDSYHCQHPPCRMHICELDPSIAAPLPSVHTVSVSMKTNEIIPGSMVALMHLTLLRVSSAEQRTTLMIGVLTFGSSPAVKEACPCLSSWIASHLISLALMCSISLQISRTQIGLRGFLTLRTRSLKSCLCEEEERNVVTLFTLNRRIPLFFAVIKGSRPTSQPDRPSHRMSRRKNKPLVTKEASLQCLVQQKVPRIPPKRNTASRLDSSSVCVLSLCGPSGLWWPEFAERGTAGSNRAYQARLFFFVISFASIIIIVNIFF